jgi:hypothetical protein
MTPKYVERGVKLEIVKKDQVGVKDVKNNCLLL